MFYIDYNIHCLNISSIYIIPDCGTLSTIDNGAYVLADSLNTTYGAPASVQCDMGYNSSVNAITCTENGTWSSTQCLAVGEYKRQRHQLLTQQNDFNKLTAL